MESLETTADTIRGTCTLPAYEKPAIRRHAVIMTMAPQGSKMGHGLFPFATRRDGQERVYGVNQAYRSG